MRRTVQIGLLFSRSGSYSLISEACRRGALDAIGRVNADPARKISFAPVERDPGGNIDLYGPLCGEILNTTSATHVIGCVTSWSRKEVIPTLERAGGTLWYACPYEGFEASDHVAYTHACPNQHLLPLLHWVFPRFGRRGYLTGSNYIWGWEMNRVARAVIADAGGAVLGERYLPIGDTDVGRMIDEIRQTRPDFVLNSMIGPSSYEFLRAFADLGRADPHFTADTCPVLSCNLTECELDALGDAAQGLISVGPYFRGSPGWPDGAARDFGSSFEAAAFAAVDTLADLLEQSPAAETASLAELLRLAPADRPRIDPATHHTRLPVLIAQVQDGAFRVIARHADVAADPYLSHTDLHAPSRRAKLSVVT